MMQQLRLYTLSLLAVGPFAPVLAAQGNEPPIAVKLESVGNSGISGTVVLTSKEREVDSRRTTDVAVTLAAADSVRQRQEFDVWLRAGTCQTPGQRVASMGDVKADGRTMQEDEDIALADLRATDHIVQVRIEDHVDVVACGAIPRRGP